jgi:hypothetical protein
MYGKGIGEGDVHPRTGHEVLQGEEIYSLLNLDARWGWVVNAMPRPIYPRKRPVTRCIGGWVGPRAGVDTVIRSPDRPARSESLHRLRYPGPQLKVNNNNNNNNNNSVDGL